MSIQDYAQLRELHRRREESTRIAISEAYNAAARVHLAVNPTQIDTTRLNNPQIRTQFQTGIGNELKQHIRTYFGMANQVNHDIDKWDQLSGGVFGFSFTDIQAQLENGLDRFNHHFWNSYTDRQFGYVERDNRQREIAQIRETDGPELMTWLRQRYQQGNLDAAPLHRINHSALRQREIADLVNQMMDNGIISPVYLNNHPIILNP